MTKRQQPTSTPSPTKHATELRRLLNGFDRAHPHPALSAHQLARREQELCTDSVAVVRAAITWYASILGQFANQAAVVPVMTRRDFEVGTNFKATDALARAIHRVVRRRRGDTR